jgi:hypothetical protein
VQLPKEAFSSGIRKAKVRKGLRVASAGAAPSSHHVRIAHIGQMHRP